MFCPKCGANNDNVASSCHSCNASFAALNAGDRVATAAKDALSSFKLFLKNPVGDLHTAFESLGQEKALGVGVTFGVAFAILVTFLATTKLPSFLSPGFSAYLKILIVSLKFFNQDLIYSLAFHTLLEIISIFLFSYLKSHLLHHSHLHIYVQILMFYSLLQP
jgi:hypothetical protein